MLKVNHSYKSLNFENTVIDVKYVILHCMCLDDKKALEFLCAQKNGVSAHYYIAKDGEIFNLVEDNKKAWHAGVSTWKNQDYLNTNSIGIELGNNGEEFKEKEYTQQQYSSLILLLQDLKTRYNIKAENILSHSDIAPDRKTDPGPLFDWSILKDNDLSVDFYQSATATNYIQHIEQFGYSLKYGQENVIKAFQRRFISDNITGILDKKTKQFINNCEIKK